MALDMSKLKVGDMVSEIEDHINLDENKDSIHRVVFIKPFEHGKFMEIGLSGYNCKGEIVERFSEFELYHIPVH